MMTTENKAQQQFKPVEFPKSLQQLNQFFATFTEWRVVRSPSGYYYFIHQTEAPSSGVYVFNCRGLSFASWRKELADYCERTQL